MNHHKTWPRFVQVLLSMKLSDDATLGSGIYATVRGPLLEHNRGEVRAAAKAFLQVLVLNLEGHEKPLRIDNSILC